MLKIQGSKKWKEMMSQSREGPYKIVVFDRYVVGCCSTEQTTTTEPKFIFCFLASKKADIFVMVSLSIIFFDFSLVHMVKNYSRTASKRGGWVALMSEWEKIKSHGVFFAEQIFHTKQGHEQLHLIGCFLATYNF